MVNHFFSWWLFIITNTWIKKRDDLSIYNSALTNSILKNGSKITPVYPNKTLNQQNSYSTYSFASYREIFLYLFSLIPKLVLNHTRAAGLKSNREFILRPNTMPTVQNVDKSGIFNSPALHHI